MEPSSGFGTALSGLDNWQVFVLSSHLEFERSFGREADKKRKLYNGKIPCNLYSYLKDSRKREEEP